MAQQNLGSAGGYLFPDPPFFGNAPSLSTTLLIDATGEKVAMIGRVWFKERTGTKDITKVGFRFGAVTKAGGSALTVSLQDVSLTASPLQPDEVQDQTVAIANANASFASNTWIQTGALSASRTVSVGDLLAVVVEYDGAGRLGADSVVISSIAASSSILQSAPALKTAAWAEVTTIANVVLEFTDGTFGTLSGALPFSALNTEAFNSGTTAGAGGDERGTAFQFPYPVTVEGGYVTIALAGTSSDFDVVLYSGTTALATCSVDANATSSTGGRLCYFDFATPQALSANTTYRLAIKPTTVNNVTIYSLDLADANHRQAWGGGVNWAYTVRTDAGAWTDTTTRRALLGLRISAGADDAGSGAGFRHFYPGQR